MCDLLMLDDFVNKLTGRMKFSP